MTNNTDSFAANSDGNRPSPLPTWLFACVSGTAVATLYYAQPMLAVMGEGLGASAASLGALPMLTQLGYAAGILFLAPLGDGIDRRKIVLLKASVLLLALLGAALSRSLGPMLVFSFAVGLAATLAQDSVSAAATLAPDASRGKVVGTVMSGLLLGILLSRVLSGAAAERFGWRASYYGAAASIALVLGLVWRFLPRVPTSAKLDYPALMKSIGNLWLRHADLRRAALAQGLISVGFSAFWSTLALMLAAPPFRLGSAVAGAFGVAGAAGALIAPAAGRLADKWGSDSVARLGSALTAASFGLLALAPALPPRMQLWLIALAVVGFDLGVQSSLVAHQTIVYRLDSAARSRLNAVLFTVIFVGMAVGSGLGGFCLSHWGWSGVVFLAIASSVAALVVRLAKPRNELLESGQKE